MEYIAFGVMISLALKDVCFGFFVYNDARDLCLFLGVSSSTCGTSK